MISILVALWSSTFPHWPICYHFYSSFRSSILSYRRDLLLSLREKDVCKRLPAGFDSSLLRYKLLRTSPPLRYLSCPVKQTHSEVALETSEIEEAASSSLEWQRSLGSSSLHPSKRSDYGPPSFSRVDGYSRGNNTRWDTRSSGSSDKDGNTLTDRDTFSQGSILHLKLLLVLRNFRDSYSVLIRFEVKPPWSILSCFYSLQLCQLCH